MHVEKGSGVLGTMGKLPLGTLASCTKCQGLSQGAAFSSSILLTHTRRQLLQALGEPTTDRRAVYVCLSS